jgi:hypothetical protein
VSTYLLTARAWCYRNGTGSSRRQISLLATTELEFWFFDIALRDYLLADDFSLRLNDFANSALISQSMDVACVDVDGCTARLDLLHLCNIIYSIMTWQKFSVRCDTETEWPSPDQMPDLEGLNVARWCVSAGLGHTIPPKN